MHMQTYEAKTYVALVWGAQASSHLPMNLISFVTFLPFLLGQFYLCLFWWGFCLCLLFLFVCLFSLRSQKCRILQPLPLYCGNHCILKLLSLQQLTLFWSSITEHWPWCAVRLLQ